MTLTLTEKKKYSYEDYLNTSDDESYELIEGELLMNPSPTPNHQTISGNIELELRIFVNNNKLGKVFDAPCDVHFDDENVMQPDIMFISKERLNIIGDKNIQAAPDLAIEIVSESSAYRDTERKKRLYAKFGVKEYWIVKPEEKTVEVYVLDNGAYRLTNAPKTANNVESPLLKGFEISFETIFNF